MQGQKIKGQQDRSKINMHEPHEVQYWTKHLKVSKEELQKRLTRSATAPPRYGKSWQHRLSNSCGALAPSVTRASQVAFGAIIATAIASTPGDRFTSVKIGAVSNLHRKG
jgi:Protein of unknown function (DUF3606)